MESLSELSFSPSVEQGVWKGRKTVSALIEWLKFQWPPALKRAAACFQCRETVVPVAFTEVAEVEQPALLKGCPKLPWRPSRRGDRNQTRIISRPRSPQAWEEISRQEPGDWVERAEPDVPRWILDNSSTYSSEDPCLGRRGRGFHGAFFPLGPADFVHFACDWFRNSFARSACPYNHRSI